MSTLADCQAIGLVLSNGRYACALPECSTTFGRLAEFKRHYKIVHQKTEVFYCRHKGCPRSEPMAGAKGKPFFRPDNRDEHERRIHGGRDMSADERATTLS
jgi:hypothetical protein